VITKEQVSRFYELLRQSVSADEIRIIGSVEYDEWLFVLLNVFNQKLRDINDVEIELRFQLKAAIRELETEINSIPGFRI
jgi:hypothetical protein